MRADSEKPYWTSKQVMDYLQISKSTLARWNRSGKLNPYKVGYGLHGHNRFIPEEIKKLLHPVSKNLAN